MIAISNSAVAAALNIRFQIGDDFKRRFRFWTDSTKTVPVDIRNRQFSIYVETTTKTRILTFEYVIIDINTIEISILGPEIGLPPIAYNWFFKEVGDTTLTMITGIFQGSDGAGYCPDTDLDVIINDCEQTIEVITIIPPIIGDPVTPVEVPIPALTEMPFFLDISQYPLFDKNCSLIAKEENDSDGYDRPNDFIISETYLDGDFTGFLITGHDNGDNQFSRNCIIVLKK